MLMSTLANLFNLSNILIVANLGHSAVMNK